MDASEHGEAQQSAESPARVLVVEDERLIRREMCRRLAAKGFETVAASGGEEALQATAEQALDAILLDWLMPDLDGLQVLARLRAQVDFAELPVIMMTARDQTEDIVAALEAGANDYVTKDVDTAVVAARLRSQVSMRRAWARVRAVEARLREEAVRDPLTGLYNRRHLMERLHAQVGLSERHEEPLSVWMCDIDHYKGVNDRYGHQAGDEVLRRFGELLRADLRREDVAARYGGDELCVVLPHTPGAQARIVAERVRLRVSGMEMGRESGTPFSVTATFGIVERMPGMDAEALLEAADGALYRAKRDGRNRVGVAGRGDVLRPDGGSARPE